MVKTSRTKGRGERPLKLNPSSPLPFVLEYFEETFNIKPQEINQIESELSHSFDIWFQMLSLLKPFKLTPELEPNYEKVHELFKWITNRSKHTLTCTLTTFTETNGPPKQKYIQMTNRLKREFENILKNDAIFLYPCHPQTAIFHHESLLKMYNIGYTAIFNVLGFPVTQCPLGLSLKGLPLGIQVVGGLDQDHLTIAVAKQLEKAFGGWRNPNSNQILL
ncbi:fatty-acid amide hydrolase 2-A-like [Centruroides sculpturatus]|uniref:fatty-acid amide hydrolase 2-A-like n=1 Tax=Centruroides sculpturatus TaxID=218467 RepID=UPI000C6DEC2C|nr:fatty-acid amide hydrolase 2-A-like [Centruroides sculpturatus]